MSSPGGLLLASLEVDQQTRGQSTHVRGRFAPEATGDRESVPSFVARLVGFLLGRLVIPSKWVRITAAFWCVIFVALAWFFSVGYYLKYIVGRTRMGIVITHLLFGLGLRGWPPLAIICCCLMLFVRLYRRVAGGVVIWNPPT